MKFDRRSSRVVLALGLAGTLIGLAGCSSGPDTDAPVEVPGASAEQNDDLNKLYQSAVGSGNTEIVAYGPSVSTLKPFLDVFRERFPGIDIVAQNQPDAQSLTKLKVEAESGNRVADIYLGGEAPQAAGEDNVCMVPDITTTPDDFDMPSEADGKAPIFAYRYFGFVYNTDQVKEEDAPKSWEDLLDPKWKDKIEIGDPTVPGGIQHILTSMMVPKTEKQWGKGFMEKLADQNPNFAQSEPTVPSDVASGRFPIGIGVYSGFYFEQEDKGGPIAMMFPLEDGGNFLSRSSFCQVKDSPDQDATSLFVNWIYTAEGQTALAEKDRSYGVLPTAPGPDGAPKFGDLKHLPYSSNDPEFNAPYFEFIKKTFS